MLCAPSPSRGGRRDQQHQCNRHGPPVVQGQAHAYTLALLATECTTPFVNLRWVLDKVHSRWWSGVGQRQLQP